MDVLKFLLAAVLLITVTACSTLPENPNVEWHKCMYEKDGKQKGPFPVPLPPLAPTVWMEDDWQVTCEPMAQAPKEA